MGFLNGIPINEAIMRKYKKLLVELTVLLAVLVAIRYLPIGSDAAMLTLIAVAIVAGILRRQRPLRFGGRPPQQD